MARRQRSARRHFCQNARFVVSGPYRGRQGRRFSRDRGLQRRAAGRLRTQPDDDPKRTPKQRFCRLSAAGHAQAKPHSRDEGARHPRPSRRWARDRRRISPTRRIDPGASRTRSGSRRRRLQLAAASDAVGNRRRGSPSRNRHRSAGRPAAGRQKSSGSSGRRFALVADRDGTLPCRDAARPHAAQPPARLFVRHRACDLSSRRNFRFRQNAAGTRYSRHSIPVSGFACRCPSLVSRIRRALPGRFWCGGRA